MSVDSVHQCIYIFVCVCSIQYIHVCICTHALIDRVHIRGVFGCGCSISPYTCMDVVVIHTATVPCVLDQAEIHVGVVRCCFASDGITVNPVKFYRLCAWVTYMYVHMYCMCV